MAILSSSSSASTSLAPGFRFHPTDEELVFYYLRRKICGKSFRVDAISEIDIYKVEPWDLPGKSRLKTRDMEWYFFSMLDKKYGNSQRTNRATEKGYWKTTGKDRAVYHRSSVVGMKKTLVYHCGRAPRGERTNWVMHEYRLIDEELVKAGFNQDAFVLCRIFQKSGSGPKNGEQYGAPLIEEEWENEDFELFPKVENAEEVEVGADAYLDGYDLDQILGTDVPPVSAPRPSEFYAGDNGTVIEDSTGSANDTQNHLVSEQPDNQNICDMPYQYDMKTRSVKHEYLGESSTTPGELDFLLDEPFWDAEENLQFGDGEFLEANDLLNPVATDAFGFDDKIDEFLAFPDANNATDDSLKFVDSNPSRMLEGAILPSCQASVSGKDVSEDTQQAISSSEQLAQHDINSGSSSKEEPMKFASECQYPFLKKASQMLGTIPAPPAFAAEFSAKDAALRLNSISQPSSSAHVTAGVIHIRNFPVGSSTDWSKSGGYNIILSFGLSREVNGAHLESTDSILQGKSVAVFSRSWLYFILFWVLVLSISFKLGSLVSAR